MFIIDYHSGGINLRLYGIYDRSSFIREITRRIHWVRTQPTQTSPPLTIIRPLTAELKSRYFLPVQQENKSHCQSGVFLRATNGARFAIKIPQDSWSCRSRKGHVWCSINYSPFADGILELEALQRELPRKPDEALKYVSSTSWGCSERWTVEKAPPDESAQLRLQWSL